MVPEQLSKMRLAQAANSQRAMSDAAAWHADDQTSNIPTCCSLSESPFGGFIDQLVECWVDVIGELNLRNGAHSLGGAPYCESDNSLLGKWCIEHPFRAKVPCEIQTTAENTAKCDILAE